MSHLVANSKERFSRDEAQFIPLSISLQLNTKVKHKLHRTQCKSMIFQYKNIKPYMYGLYVYIGDQKKKDFVFMTESQNFEHL